MISRRRGRLNDRIRAVNRSRMKGPEVMIDPFNRSRVFPQETSDFRIVSPKFSPARPGRCGFRASRKVDVVVDIVNFWQAVADRGLAQRPSQLPGPSLDAGSVESQFWSGRARSFFVVRRRDLFVARRRCLFVDQVWGLFCCSRAPAKQALES
jgi:hypothetical protein